MKNFLKGYGNILRLVPTHKFPRVEIKNFPKNDTDALQRDWEMIGKDISNAMKAIDNDPRK